MIRIKRKMVAILGGAAVIASGALFASPAQAAMTCQPVQGQTIGADVKVGDVTTRVPAISGIQVCAGTGTAPVVTVKTSGGTCTSNCLSVIVGGGAVDLEGMSVQWKEDGVARTQAINPAPVPGPAGTCVFSVGIPDAPDPGCFIAIGPDDPTGVTDPIMRTVNDAITLGLQTVAAAERLTCATIPDWYRPGYGYQDFCTNPVGWTQAVAEDGTEITCNAIPDMYDEWGYSYDFCTNPVGWSIALYNTYYEYGCSWIPGAYGGYPYYDYVEFCDDPVRWTQYTLDTWCGSLCDVTTLDRLIDSIRIDLQRNIQENVNDNVQVTMS